MNDDLKAAIHAIEAAIHDEGPEPRYHHKMMAKHRAEWPTLWRAIDALLAATKRA